MKLRILSLRLMAGALLAAAALAAGTPAGAQDAAPQDTPWYMPQPWVYPPQTGPQVRKLPGQYGHTYRNRSYGSFSRYCYGDCRELPGTIAARGGAILWRPAVALFDPRGYQIVPRVAYEAPQAAAPARQAAARPAQPAVVPVNVPTGRAQQLQPKFSMQNGVRIIRPAPITPY